GVLRGGRTPAVVALPAGPALHSIDASGLREPPQGPRRLAPPRAIPPAPAVPRQVPEAAVTPRVPDTPALEAGGAAGDRAGASGGGRSRCGCCCRSDSSSTDGANEPSPV